MNWRDPSWRYQSSATHADGNEFRKRQRERMRKAEEARQMKPVAVAIPIRKQERTK